MTPLTTFFCGLGLLILFFGYFVTDDSKKKRLIGTLLAIFVTAFCAFFIVHTGNLPDSFSLKVEQTGDNAGKPISDEQRDKVVEALRTELRDEKDKTQRFAITARQNLVSISRKDLDKEQIEKVTAELKDLGLSISVTEDEKPATAIQKGIDLQGGVSFTVRIDPDIDPETGEKRPVSDDARQQVIAVLQKRLDPDGGKNLTPIPQGDDRVVIQMPGITAAEASGYEKTIETVARLEFRMVKHGSFDVSMENEPEVEPGWTVLPFKPGQTDKKGNPIREGRGLIVRNRAEITGDSVARAFGYPDPNDGNVIILELDGEGADKWADITTKSYNKAVQQAELTGRSPEWDRFAVIIDDEIVIAPNIVGAITGGTSKITGGAGGFKLEEAREIAALLENPLKNPLVIEEFSEISATYGADTISQGIKAGIAGLLITLVFMVVYYRIAGLIALFGLLINIIILFGTLCIFEFSLTMPGIAGILLTIGMAVDANVLIFERLKEELRAGKSLGGALEAAYNKAFSAIFDANVTTLITSIILFWVASGIIKGFAVTLTIGILASLFAALIITRVCFNWATAGGVIKKLSFPNLVDPKMRDFLSRRKIAFVISSVLVVSAIATLATKGKSSFGMDFLGGAVTELQLSEGQSITEKEVREVLQPVTYTDAEGKEQTLGNSITYQLQTGASGEFVVIRSPEVKQPKTGTDSEKSDSIVGKMVKETLVKEFGDRIESTVDDKTGETIFSARTQEQGSLIGEELAQRSLWALFASLIAILIYVSIRFEFSFALGAIIALFHDLIICTGIVVLSGRELNLILVGAFLTIAGYSINDTIVVFDRIREMLRTKRGEVKDVMNLAISQTLSRTILTSVTTLVTVITLFIFGGPVLADFSFAIIIGILVGTYSSIFVASPVVLWWARSRKRNLRREVLDAESEKMDATTPA